MPESAAGERRKRSTDALERSFEDAVRRDSGVRKLWTQPRLELRAAAQEGELFFARLRIAIVAVFVPFPLLRLAESREALEAWLGALVVLGALVLAVVLLRLASTRESLPWLAFASTWVDVSILTAALALYAWLSDPLAATNSQFAWGIYLLMIAASALRYDPRICLWAGGWAALQYLSLVAASRYRLAHDLDSAVYGAFTWNTQAARVILMLLTSFLAWVLVRRAEQLWRLSVRDPRTGLFNHTFFVDRLEETLARAERAALPVTLAMVDVDNFKQINDRYGHAAGDRVLEAVATALSQGVRSHDLVGRYGGDEFAVLMPGASLEQARRRMSDLVATLANLEVAVRSDTIPPPSISVGLATAPADGATAANLLHSADRRLYTVKEQGRGDVLGVG